MGWFWPISKPWSVVPKRGYLFIPTSFCGFIHILTCQVMKFWLKSSDYRRFCLLTIWWRTKKMCWRPICTHGVNGSIGYVVTEVRCGAEGVSWICGTGYRGNHPYKEWNVVQTEEEISCTLTLQTQVCIRYLFSLFLFAIMESRFPFSFCISYIFHGNYRIFIFQYIRKAKKFNKHGILWNKYRQGLEDKNLIKPFKSRILTYFYLKREEVRVAPQFIITPTMQVALFQLSA